MPLKRGKDSKREVWGLPEDTVGELDMPFLPWLLEQGFGSPEVWITATQHESLQGK